jgi:hypothetical protein
VIISKQKKAQNRSKIMPYVSDAQRRWAHTSTGTKALGGSSKVKEWDQASKGKDLPERVPKMAEGGPVKKGWKGGGPVSASYAQGGSVLQSGPSVFAKERGNPVKDRGEITLPEKTWPQKSRFMREPDVYRTGIERQDYGGKDPLATGGDDKSEKPIKPRK